MVSNDILMINCDSKDDLDDLEVKIKLIYIIGFIDFLLINLDYKC